ncbi:hypothetical protein F2Q68_00011696 [Brassica cretica]|uniref:Uncharacterized protein n=1 Tax=Brassica cretica TaxID=69181 RepID=A0A8S9L0E3_BRACR|nr:hypothetical protein F2Q68_00011696 [Brassica cretica]
MTKRPLSKHEVEQTKGAQRPPVVAPRGHSRLRERLVGVAARGRSRSLPCPRAMKTRATSPRRSGKVALVPPDAENASDIGVSLWPSRSEVVSQRLHGVAPVGRPHALLVQ